MSKTTARTREALLDFAELLAKAFFGGLGVAIAMALAILALSPASQAAALTANDAHSGRPISAAPQIPGIRATA